MAKKNKLCVEARRIAETYSATASYWHENGGPPSLSMFRRSATPPSILKRLAQHPTQRVRIDAFSHPRIPAFVLTNACYHTSNLYELTCIAENKNTPMKCIFILMNRSDFLIDPDDNSFFAGCWDSVMREFFNRKGVPTKAIEKLATANNIKNYRLECTIAEIAKYKATPRKTLLCIANTVTTWYNGCCERILFNRYCDKDILRKAYSKVRRRMSPYAAELVAEKRYLPADIYIDLAKHPSSLVRARLVSNPKVPKEVIEKLKTDKTGQVKFAIKCKFGCTK